MRNQIESEARAAVERCPASTRSRSALTLRCEPTTASPASSTFRSRTSSPWPAARAAWARHVSVNLAVALAQMGAKVGLLDADIYGPNIPMMMGVDECRRRRAKDVAGRRPRRRGHVHRLPGSRRRGARLARADAAQGDPPALHRRAWSDWTTCGRPAPGTGDAQLSLAQLVPLTGGIIVSTPQAVSLADARAGSPRSSGSTCR